jgi:hypothetical protein
LNKLSPRQTPVFDPMRLIGIDTEAALFVFFVLAVIAVEKFDL